MVRKTAGLLIIVLLAVPIMAFKIESSTPAAGKKVGYALLELLSQTFYEMTVSGTGEAGKLTESLQKCAGEARKAREQNQIDAVFFASYFRLLGIVKLAMAPDPDGILAPVINRELALFVYYVLAEESKSSGPEAIGQVAKAIRDEIINLQLYLDNLDRKEELRKAWDEKFARASEKKKGGIS